MPVGVNRSECPGGTSASPCCNALGSVLIPADPPAPRAVIQIADFWKEAELLSSLHHPNVVAFYGVVKDKGKPVATVTEYMVNGSLKQVLQKKDRSAPHPAPGAPDSVRMPGLTCALVLDMPWLSRVCLRAPSLTCWPWCAQDDRPQEADPDRNGCVVRHGVPALEAHRALRPQVRQPARQHARPPAPRLQGTATSRAKRATSTNASSGRKPTAVHCMCTSTSYCALGKPCPQLVRI